MSASGFHCVPSTSRTYRSVLSFLACVFSYTHQSWGKQYSMIPRRLYSSPTQARVRSRRPRWLSGSTCITSYTLCRTVRRTLTTHLKEEFPESKSGPRDQTGENQEKSPRKAEKQPKTTKEKPKDRNKKVAGGGRRTLRYSS